MIGGMENIVTARRSTESISNDYTVIEHENEKFPAIYVDHFRGAVEVNEARFGNPDEVIAWLRSAADAVEKALKPVSVDDLVGVLGADWTGGTGSVEAVRA